MPLMRWMWNQSAEACRPGSGGGVNTNPKVVVLAVSGLRSTLPSRLMVQRLW